MMLGAQLVSVLISAVRNGATNVAAPVRYGILKASASFMAGLFFLAAIGCVTAAIWIYAIPYWGEPSAALIAGIFLFVIGIVVLGISSLVIKPHVTPVTIHQTEQLPLMLNQVFKDQKGTLLLAALIAGMVASEKQRKR
jgi:hypothetical protein